MLVAAAEGVLSFSRNKSRETEGVGRRWSLLSAALGGKQGRVGQRQRAVQGKGERSRGERVAVARRSGSGQRGNGGWKQRQGKRKGELPVVRCERRQRRAPEGDLRLLDQIRFEPNLEYGRLRIKYRKLEIGRTKPKPNSIRFQI